MAAKFTAAELAPSLGRLGFDDEVSPPWVMVPVGGKKVVNLRDGAGLSLQLRTVWNPSGRGVVTYREEPGTFSRTFVLEPTSPGTAFLEARDSAGQVQASLEITVKDRLTLQVVAYTVYDQGGCGKTQQQTAEHMTQVASALYLPQANIELVFFAWMLIGVPFNLDAGLPTFLSGFGAPKEWIRNTPGPLPCIASREPDYRGCLPEDTVVPPLKPQDFNAIRKYQMWCNILSNIMPRFDYHFFLVRSLAQDRLPSITRAFTPNRFQSEIALNACFIPDQFAFGQVLAHEFGHYNLTPNPSFMDKNGHSNGKHDLMQENPALPDEIKIPKNQSNYMNPSGIQHAIG
jgi:hypothetical protein